MGSSRRGSGIRRLAPILEKKKRTGLMSASSHTITYTDMTDTQKTIRIEGSQTQFNGTGRPRGPERPSIVRLVSLLPFGIFQSRFTVVVLSS